MKKLVLIGLAVMTFTALGSAQLTIDQDGINFTEATSPFIDGFTFTLTDILNEDNDAGNNMITNVKQISGLENPSASDEVVTRSYANTQYYEEGQNVNLSGNNVTSDTEICVGNECQ